MADNLLDKASILLTPTAYNDGSMLSIKPENGDGDFTFSRSSAATRVNAQGLVENVQIISSELVSNGNFSQIGTEEVSNGNFSQEGSELVTNGDFSNGLTNWYVDDGTSWTNVNNTAFCDGNNGLIAQNITSTQNKVYKVTFDSVATNSSGKELGVRIDGGTYAWNLYPTGTHTIYLTAGSSGTQGVLFYAMNGWTGSIDNVSVKEVGQDWSFVSGATIGDDKAIISGDGSVAGLIEQTSVFSSGKTYKITLDAVINSGGGLNVKHGIGFADNIGSMITTGTYTFYYTAPSTKSLVIARKTGGVAYDSTITNISVKEVGQDWTFGTGWSMEDRAFYNDSATNQLSQSISLTSGVKYKLTFDIELDTVNQAYIWIGNSGGSVNYTGTNYVFYPTGSHTVYFTMPSSQTTLAFYGNQTGGAFYITNISVKEITDDTDLPRINYEGFSYQDSLGSEEVVNGDFSNGSANWVNNNSSLSIESGKLKVSSTSGYGNAEQNISVEGGKTYEVSADFTYGGTTEGRLNLYDGSATPMEISKSEDGIISTQITISSGQTNLRIRLVNQSATIGVYNLWNNVSVKEYLGQEVVPDSGCGSWLLEPQSTNLIPYSSDFSRSNWVKVNNAIVSATKVISPDGTLNASQIIFDGTSQGRIEDAIPSLIQGADYTVSVYARVSSGTQAVRLGSVNDFEYTLTTEWQRLTSTEVENDTVGYPRFKCNDAATIEIWGFQLENQSFSTSYIPSSGAASTRLQDIANNSGNSTLINSTEGVLYFEGSYPKTTSGSGNKRIAISDGTSSNRVMFAEIGNTGLGALITSQGVNSAYITGSLDNLSNFKAAISYKQNDFALWINGLKVAIDTSGNVPIGLNEIAFDGGDGTNDFFGKTKALAVYKEALTNANLRSLTYPNPVATTFDLDFDTIAEQFTFTRGSEATFVNAQGLIESTASNDAPRIDYSTGAKAFLLEPQSTNIINYSEDFSQWNADDATLISNSVVSPDGTQNASTLIGSTLNSRHHIRKIVSGSVDASFSLFVKAKELKYLQIASANTVNQYVNFDVESGIIGTVGSSFSNAKIENYGNGWYRVSVVSLNQYNTYYISLVSELNAGWLESWVMPNNTDGLYLWGAMLENQSYATSYIPTSGASATRNQELCNNATPVINSEEGTLYAEISALANDGTYRSISISDSSRTNIIEIDYTNDEKLRILVKSANVVVFSVLFVLDITIYTKLAVKYKLNDFEVFINGIKEYTITNGVAPIGLSELAFDRGDGGTPFFGNTKGLKYYPKALADVQLEDLTTI